MSTGAWLLPNPASVGKGKRVWDGGSRGSPQPPNPEVPAGASCTPGRDPPAAGGRGGGGEVGHEREENPRLAESAAPAPRTDAGPRERELPQVSGQQEEKRGGEGAAGAGGGS